MGIPSDAAETFSGVIEFMMRVVQPDRSFPWHWRLTAC